jgi:AcrR family transcriptional regulator
VRTIQTRGVEALTLRAAGQTLGVSRSALYRHFADKAALLRAVAQEGFRMLRLELVKAWDQAGGGRHGFEQMGLAYVRFAVEHQAHYSVMFGGFLRGYASDAALAAEGSAAFQVLVDALVAQQLAGLVRQDDPQQLAQLVWAVVHGVARLAIDGQLRGPQAGTDALTRYAIERLRTGIAPAAAPDSKSGSAAPRS